jgi:hypothetical protein
LPIHSLTAEPHRPAMRKRKRSAWTSATVTGS